MPAMSFDRVLRQRMDRQQWPTPKRGPLLLGHIWLVGRGECLFVFHLDFEETGDRECDAETELGFVAEASQDRADFLQ